MRFILFFLGMLLLPVSSMAEELSPQEMVNLNSYKHGIITLQENTKAGIITDAQAQAGIDRYVELANDIGSFNVMELLTLEDPNLKIVQAELTIAQKVVGAISFMTIMYVIATFVFVISIGILFKDVVIVFFMGLWSLPKTFYEVIAYAASAGTIASAYFVWPEFNQALSFLGVIGVGGSMVLSAMLRDIDPKPKQFFGTILAISVPLAIVFMNPWLGFISAVAFMGMVGFSVLVTPGCVAMGFEEEDTVAPGTMAGFYLLSITCIAVLLNAPYIELFRTGGIWMGSFVFFLGLLILSSKWFPGKNYALMQVVTLIAGIAAILVGSVFGFPILMKIGGTFFVLYLLEKTFEIPVDSVVGFAVLGLISSSMIGVLYFLTKSYPHLVQYLFLV